VDVEQNDVRHELLDRPHSLIYRPALPDDIDLLVERLVNSRAEEGVIVDDQDPRGCHGAHSLLSRLTVISISVPPACEERTVALPPARLIRPMIDSRTPRRAAGAPAGSKPGPRSRTKTRMPSCPTSAKTETGSPPPNFAALSIASRDSHDLDRTTGDLLYLGGCGF
jgi:hypothetical protein